MKEVSKNGLIKTSHNFDVEQKEILEKHKSKYHRKTFSGMVMLALGKFIKDEKLEK